jgi:hypothetical protein
MNNKNALLTFILGVITCSESCAYYVNSGVIYDTNNVQVKVDGISWSGFQDSKNFQGLSSNPFYSLASVPSSYNKTYGMLDALVRPWDFIDTGVTKSTGVSFKTVRLPMQPGVLYDTEGKAEFNKSLTNKANRLIGNGVFCKTWELSGVACSDAVSPKEAFWISIEEFKKNNVKVLIDFHHKYGYGDGYRDGTVYDLNQYAKDINEIISQIKNRNLTNVIGIDVFNEPHRLRWFRDNGGQPAWIKVIATAAKELYKSNPELLLFVEGAGPGSGDPDQPAICVNSSDIVRNDEAYAISNDPLNCATGTNRVDFKGNWGEDFKPLIDAAKSKTGKRSFDRTRFINELKTAGLTDSEVVWLMGGENANKGHLVFSPHVYPREVATWESAPGKPSELRFDWTWGFLREAGYPVVLGEASWKSSQGLSFFNNAIAPYLQQKNMQNDLFFWAIGYLGDTISMIDPNSGSVNLEAQKTLHDLYRQNTNFGTLGVNFTSPGFNLIGSTTLTFKETAQVYNCPYIGCSINLDKGVYTTNVSDTYQVDKNAHIVYKVNAIGSPFAVTIEKDQTSTLPVALEGEQYKSQPATTINYKINLLDDKGMPVSNSGVSTAIQFKSKNDSTNMVSCTVQAGECKTEIYNQALNNQTGNFSTEGYTVNLPNQLNISGKTYKLISNRSDTSLEVPIDFNISSLNATYQQDAVPTNQSCSVNLTMQNRWENGAVFQGAITNTSKASIKSFKFKLSFNNSEVINPKITGTWIGNNSNVYSNLGEFTLSALTYDQYNGIPAGGTQSIGFSISGTILKDIQLNMISCEAK